MPQDLSATALLTRARDGDKAAWEEIIERYAPLIWSICRGYRLSRADADDVGQSVWLRLVDHLAAIRDPGALPGWLATTTRRECGRVVTASRRREALGQSVDAEDIADPRLEEAEHEVLRAERGAALREAFAQLPQPCQRLLALLAEDPPLPYSEISTRLGIPVGSIGPNRGRCLERVRRHPAVAALIKAEAGTRGGEMHGQPAVGG